MSTLTVKELAAPVGYDLTLASGETLDLSGGTVTLPSGTDGSGLTGVSAGVSDISKWDISAFTSGTDLNPITGTWTGTLIKGSNMSQSSGIFTFPSTGMWEVDLRGTYYKSDGSSLSIEAVSLNIYKSTDGGSTWGDDPEAVAHNAFDSPGNDWWRVQVSASTIIDVTSTANVKVKFRTYVYGSNSLYQNHGGAAGGMVFKRIGDT